MWWQAVILFCINKNKQYFLSLILWRKSWEHNPGTTWNIKTYKAIFESQHIPSFGEEGKDIHCYNFTLDHQESFTAVLPYLKGHLAPNFQISKDEYKKIMSSSSEFWDSLKLPNEHKCFVLLYEAFFGWLVRVFYDFFFHLSFNCRTQNLLGFCLFVCFRRWKAEKEFSVSLKNLKYFVLSHLYLWNVICGTVQSFIECSYFFP